MIPFSLKKLNVVFFLIAATLIIQAELLKRIVELSPPDKDGDSVFNSYAKVEGNSQAVFAWISSPKKNGYCSLNINVLPGKDKTKLTLPTPDELFALLSENKDEVNFNCSIGFKYKDVHRVKPIIRLPLIISEHPNSELVEIRGIHVRNVKVPSTEAILDLSSDGSLQASIDFQNKTKITNSTVIEIFECALAIGKSFVFWEH